MMTDASYACSVIDLFMPEFIPIGNPIPIVITVTNIGDSQGSHDIPIILSDLDDSTRVVTLVINVTLDVGERKDVLVDGIKMRKGNYLV